MANSLFIFGQHYRGNAVISLKIGSRSHGRRVYLTEAEALQLGYKLMSLGSGGETAGSEEFPLSAP